MHFLDNMMAANLFFIETIQDKIHAHQIVVVAFCRKLKTPSEYFVTNVSLTFFVFFLFLPQQIEMTAIFNQMFMSLSKIRGKLELILMINWHCSECIGIAV